MDACILIKICSDCKQEKSINEFGMHAKQKDGRQRQCKICHRAYFAKYRDENREEERARQRKWRENHPEEVIRIRRNVDPKKATEYRQRYRAKHSQKVKEKAKHYRKRTAEQSKEVRRRWAERNKARLCAKAAARRALQLQATPLWANMDAISRIYEECQRISKETGIEHHVDHGVPLKSDLVCGLHCEANLTIMIGSDNQSKGNRWWPDMPE